MIVARRFLIFRGNDWINKQIMKRSWFIITPGDGNNLIIVV